jgi:hypothetical protein
MRMNAVPANTTLPLVHGVQQRHGIIWLPKEFRVAGSRQFPTAKSARSPFVTIFHAGLKTGVRSPNWLAQPADLEPDIPGDVKKNTKAVVRIFEQLSFFWIAPENQVGDKQNLDQFE